MQKSKSNCLFEPASRLPTRKQVMEMVTTAEKELEFELHKKRNRLQIKMSNEINEHNQEIRKKYELLNEQEHHERIDDLERMKIDRELDRQKFVERKQLEQHLRNSQELRLEMSKKLLEECDKSRAEQIQEKIQSEQSAQAELNAFVQEARRKQLEEMQKEAETKVIAKQQKNWQAKQELHNEFARKMKKQKQKQAEIEIERKLLQQTDDAIKIREEELKKIKQQKIQSQKEFLKHQIEQRKKDEEYLRQREIQYAKTIAELNEQQMKREADTIELAKKMQNEENFKFIDYVSRMRKDKQDIESSQTDLRQLSLISEEMEANAKMKRQEKKQLLNKELMNEYVRKQKEKEAIKQHEKQLDVYSLEATQRENTEYEEMMAARKAQNRAQLLEDLKHQIEFKNIEMAYNAEQDARLRQKIDSLDNASNTLTKKLLDEGIDAVLPKHPFYKCLLDKN